MVGKTLLTAGLVAVVLVAAGCSTLTGDGEVVQIGITQIVEHPALDAARQGFIAGLAQEGFVEGDDVVFDIRSAQGETANAQIIAENFVSQDKDMILAISTPSAQAAFRATKHIPILITAVTDPFQAGLINSWEEPGTNVTGTSDRAPIASQFQLLKQLVPEARTVGIVFNTGEINSEIQVEEAKAVAAELGLEIVTAGVSDLNDIQVALDTLLEKVDVVYTPTDNMVASAMPIIISRTLERGIPVLGAETAHVTAGALATEGVDYFQLGFETGLQAAQILRGSNPAEMKVNVLQDTQLTINKTTADKLGIKIPQDLLAAATLVEQES